MIGILLELNGWCRLTFYLIAIGVTEGGYREILDAAGFHDDCMPDDFGTTLMDVTRRVKDFGTERTVPVSPCLTNQIRIPPFLQLSAVLISPPHKGLS